MPEQARLDREAADRIEAQAAEIRSLRAQVAQERAGTVRWLRDTHDGRLVSRMAIADAIKAQQDKEPQT